MDMLVDLTSKVFCLDSRGFFSRLNSSRIITLASVVNFYPVAGPLFDPTYDIFKSIL